VEVILLEHLETLGRRGEVVRVKPGYARNFLLPRRLAMLATPGAKRLVEQEARKFAVIDERARTDAEAVAQRLGEDPHLDATVLLRELRCRRSGLRAARRSAGWAG